MLLMSKYLDICFALIRNTHWLSISVFYHSSWKNCEKNHEYSNVFFFS